MLHTHIPCAFFTSSCTTWCSSSGFCIFSSPQSILDLTEPSTKQLISPPSASAVSCMRGYRCSDRKSSSSSRQETHVWTGVLPRAEMRFKILRTSCRACFSHSSSPSMTTYVTGCNSIKEQNKSSISCVPGVRCPCP